MLITHQNIKIHNHHNRIVCVNQQHNAPSSIRMNIIFRGRKIQIPPSWSTRLNDVIVSAKTKNHHNCLHMDRYTIKGVCCCVNCCSKKWCVMCLCVPHPHFLSSAINTANREPHTSRSAWIHAHIQKPYATIHTVYSVDSLYHDGALWLMCHSCRFHYLHFPFAIPTYIFQRQTHHNRSPTEGTQNTHPSAHTKHKT